MNIEIIKKLVSQNKIRLTEHFLKRISQRNIKISDIILVLKNGKIIENYPNDFPYPSCLILGFNRNNIPFHVVCGICNEEIWLITSYIPSTDKWIDFKERKV